MKKQSFSLLLAITGIFIAFSAGLFIGRTAAGSDILISGVSATPTHAHKQPETLPSTPEASEESISFPLDVNTATQQELMTLPGIGEVLAGRILDYREENGPFLVPEELLNVPGIGTGKLEPILDLITTGGQIS